MGDAPKATPEEFNAEDGMPLNPNDGPAAVQIQYMAGQGDGVNGEAKVEIGNTDVPKFVGLGKEELMKYANDPFWVRLRWFLFILFWIIWVGMLAGAIIIIVMAPKCSNETLKGKAYYQINIPDFAKGGKLQGLLEHVDYVKALGFNNVILSQVFKHIGSDRLDVSDFKDVDGEFGSLEDFEAVVKKFKEKEINVFLDMIPNHSGKQHMWFTDHIDYYAVKPTDQVTSSTWKTLENTLISAWDEHPIDRNRSYLHIYKKDNLADFNFTNDKVIEAWKDIISFWKGKGVEGVLLSGVSYLVEDYTELSKGGAIKNQEENVNVIQKLLDGGLNALLDFDGLTAPKRVEYYKKGLKPIAKDFLDLNPAFTAQNLHDIVESYDPIPNGAVWQLSNIRSRRVATKFTEARANILAMVAFLSKGSVVHYFGEEIGMTSSGGGNANNMIAEVSKGPMDWSKTDEKQNNKFLGFYKTLVKLHNDMDGEPGTTKLSTDGDSFSFKRATSKEYAVAVNLNESSKATLDLAKTLTTPAKGKVLAKTPNIPDTILKVGDTITANELEVPPSSGIVLGFDLAE